MRDTMHARNYIWRGHANIITNENLLFFISGRLGALPAAAWLGASIGVRAECSYERMNLQKVVRLIYLITHAYIQLFDRRCG